MFVSRGTYCCSRVILLDYYSKGWPKKVTFVRPTSISLKRFFRTLFATLYDPSNSKHFPKYLSKFWAVSLMHAKSQETVALTQNVKIMHRSCHSCSNWQKYCQWLKRQNVKIFWQNLNEKLKWAANLGPINQISEVLESCKFRYYN